jgi:hypothetical protein
MTNGRVLVEREEETYTHINTYQQGCDLPAAEDDMVRVLKFMSTENMFSCQNGPALRIVLSSDTQKHTLHTRQALFCLNAPLIAFL